MSYHLQSRKKPARKVLKATIALVLFFSVVFLIRWIFPNFFSALFNIVSFPSFKAEQAIDSTSPLLSSLFKSKQEIVRENISLKEDIEEIKLNMLAFDALLRENAELKEMLGRKNSVRITIASVLARPPQTFYDTLLLDAGSDNSISIGDKVLVGSTTAIGEISEVFENRSIALLYSAPGKKVNVLIGENNVSGVAEGQGNGNFSVKMPKDILIEKGDQIVVPSLSTEIYGVVEDVITKPADSFQYILFRTPVNMRNMRFVGIENL